MNINNDQIAYTAAWFKALRDNIIVAFEGLELRYIEHQKHNIQNQLTHKKFTRKLWHRTGGGGGEMSIMYGNVFEKVGVNISTVHGSFSKEFAKEIPGADIDPSFFATGISLVAHMKSPLLPAVHFNTRYIKTTKWWFGGGTDLTPTYVDQKETNKFHDILRDICNKHNQDYYPKFKQQCDEYFYLKHRKEPRGVGGIFYDYLNTGNYEKDFHFTQDVGQAFLQIYPEIVQDKMLLPWTQEQKTQQLIKRGRYVEFNLLYDRGTKFGLMTDGNVDAILMSMPPSVIWT